MNDLVVVVGVILVGVLAVVYDMVACSQRAAANGGCTDNHHMSRFREAVVRPNVTGWRDLGQWRRVDTKGLLLYSCPLCSALTEEPYNHRQWHDREGHWGDETRPAEWDGMSG